MHEFQIRRCRISNSLQLMLTKKRGCWKIIFGRIESANYLIETKTIGTIRNKSNGRPAVFNTSYKGSDIYQISNCSSLLTQPLNSVTKIIPAYCRRSSEL